MTAQEREALICDIAKEVVRQLETQHSWKEFLPPVALRDCIYIATKDGDIYRLSQDMISGMELIVQIRRA